MDENDEPCAACGAESCPNPTFPDRETCQITRGVESYLCLGCWRKPSGAVASAITRRKSLAAKTAEGWVCTGCIEAKHRTQSIANLHRAPMVTFCNNCKARHESIPQRVLPCSGCQRKITKQEDAGSGGELPICAACKSDPPRHNPDPADNNYLTCDGCGRRESAPFAPDDECPLCHGKLREDPDPRIIEDQRIAALTVTAAAAKAQHLADFDRPILRALPSREQAVLGRVFRPVRTKGPVGHPSSWPSQEGEEP